MINKEFGLLQIGDKGYSTIARTLTETDVVNFCMITGNWLGLHADIEYARKSRFGQRVVQGSLIFSIANSLIPFDPTLIEAFYGVDALRYPQPTFIGDTIRASTEIVDLRDAKNFSSGIATLLLKALNQKDEIVMTCHFSLLIRKTRLENTEI